MQICNAKDNATFPGTGLVNCAPLAADIKTCQSKGKILTLSLGGGGASVGFQSDSDAQALADTIWNDFLGGSSATRPFGDAVLDGCVMSSAPRRSSALTGPLFAHRVDLDIEQGGSDGYAAFVTRLRSHFSGASKKYVSF